jgi:hypothetical protein
MLTATISIVAFVIGLILGVAIDAPVEFEAKINVSTLFGTATTLFLAFAIPIWLQRALNRRSQLGSALLEPATSAWNQMSKIHGLVSRTDGGKGLTDPEQKEVIREFRGAANSLSVLGSTLKAINAPRSVQTAFVLMEGGVRGYKGAVTGDGMPTAKLYTPSSSQRSEIARAFIEVSQAYYKLLASMHRY